MSLQEKMFDNIGPKLITVSQVLIWVGIAASILSGVVMFFSAFTDTEQLGYLLILAPVTTVVGCFSSWLAFISLYAIGKTLNTANQNAYQIDKVSKELEDLKIAVAPEKEEKAYEPMPISPKATTKQIKVSKGETWSCPNCGKTNLDIRNDCWSCGAVVIEKN